MAFQQVPDTVEVRCIMDYLGSEHVTTYYARHTAPYDASDVDTVHEAIGEAFRDHMMIHLTVDVTFDRTEVRDLNTEFGYSAVIEYNTAGTQAQDTAPAQMPVLIKFVGDPGAAPRQGHHFISGVRLVLFDADTGLYDQSIVDSLVVGEGEVRDAISAAGITNEWAQVLVSRVHNKALRVPATTNTLQDISGRRLPGSQRDRRPGIGS